MSRLTVIKCTTRPLTDDEMARLDRVGNRRMDILFRLNGDTDLEYADVYPSGGEADMVARTVQAVARAIHEHGGKPK